MILEMRTYQVQAGKAPEFLRVYEQNGLNIITRYAKLVGCWNKESGTLNAIGTPTQPITPAVIISGTRFGIREHNNILADRKR